MSVEEVRQILLQSSTSSLVDNLDRLFRDFSHRKYLLNSVFYAGFGEICERLFITNNTRPALLRAEKKTFNLLSPNGGSLFIYYLNQLLFLQDLI